MNWLKQRAPKRPDSLEILKQAGIESEHAKRLLTLFMACMRATGDDAKTAFELYKSLMYDRVHWLEGG